MRHHLGLNRSAAILLIGLAMIWTGGACATKGFVRQEVQATAAPLETRIENNETGIKQNAEQIQGNANQISELSALNRQNTQGIETLKGDVTRVDSKAGEAQSMANRAQETADGATGRVASLDERFSNRNRYTVLAEKIINFKFDSSVLDDSYQADLIQVAAIVKENPDAMVVLEGHTDTTGDAAYNIRLGERRMEAVYRSLVIEQEVPIHRIHKMSFGEARPLAENDTTEGRSKNRSTVIRVLAPRSDDLL